jgi:hypothetical protein
LREFPCAQPLLALLTVATFDVGEERRVCGGDVWGGAFVTAKVAETPVVDVFLHSQLGLDMVAEICCCPTASRVTEHVVSEPVRPMSLHCSALTSVTQSTQALGWVTEKVANGRV